jgi:hypothetical protein
VSKLIWLKMQRLHILDQTSPMWIEGWPPSLRFAAPQSFRAGKFAMLHQHFEEAKRHVALGEEHISRQRGIIAQLERDGHDATEAKTLLEQFQEIQKMRIAHRYRFARELGMVANDVLKRP